MSYWSTHSSLYHDLSSWQMQSLERAVRLRFRGEYLEALKDFESLDPSTSELPVTEIGLAVLYECMESTIIGGRLFQRTKAISGL